MKSLQRSAERREQKAYLAEGVRLVREALETGQTPLLVLFDPEALARTASGFSLLESLPAWAPKLQPVTSRVLAAAAQTENPGGILAVLRLPVWPGLASHAGAPTGIVLDRLADPGNAGTIVRTADAFNVGYIVTLPGTTDLYAPKVVRAGMGAHFRMPVYQHVPWALIREALPQASIVAADARHGTSVMELHWPRTVLLVIGSEASGFDIETQRHVHEFVRIPIRPRVESLNAAVAAAILIHASVTARSLLGD